jgi:hypothetical protein
MVTPPASKKPWLKKLLLGGSLVLLVVAAIIWYLFTLKFDDTAELKPDFQVEAMALIGEFASHNAAANTKYTEKIIEVKGTVSAVEKADTTVNLKFIDSATGSYAIFAFQDQHAAAASQVNPGDVVSIKGSCSGGNYSQILETTFITFKRCALVK